MTVVLPFRLYSSLIDHSCFKNASHLTLRGNSLKILIFLVFLIFLPLEIWHKLCCHNFETIFLHLWTRSISLLELYSYDQFIQNNGSTISSFLFKSSSEFLICCTFKNSSSSSFWYTFASHACNLGSHTTFLLSFDSFQVTIQHATIVVHENCWDNFKSSPRLL